MRHQAAPSALLIHPVTFFTYPFGTGLHTVRRRQRNSVTRTMLCVLYEMFLFKLNLRIYKERYVYSVTPSLIVCISPLI